MGRSGRFGKKGVSISLVNMEDYKDKKNFDNLCKNFSLDIEEIPDNISSYLT